jgi:hypothetical protein
MAFVKLDCGILDSTIWIDKEARDIFVTALLMAEPLELDCETPQLEVRTTKETGWIVPPGWYGMVRAAGIGIANRAGVDREAGLAALERIGSPEPDSRTPDFEGRRMVRISGGFIVLNYDRYRQRDYTGAERQRRFRERRNALQDEVTRNITQAEGEAEGEASQSAFDTFWLCYPKKVGKDAARTAFKRKKLDAHIFKVMDALAAQKKSAQWLKDGGQFIPHPATWINQGRWQDEQPNGAKPPETKDPDGWVRWFKERGQPYRFHKDAPPYMREAFQTWLQAQQTSRGK